MKKGYFKPTMDVVDFHSEHIMALSNGSEVNPGINNPDNATNKFQGGWNQEKWNTEN